MVSYSEHPALCHLEKCIRKGVGDAFMLRGNIGPYSDARGKYRKVRANSFKRKLGLD